MSFTPRDLSREQADLYLAHTEATLELRLTELAHWMAASRGPIGEMDGSVASVQTLWEWSIRFIDSRAVKMIPRNQLTDHDIMFGETSAVAHRRRFYVAQAAPIYILEVLRRLDPTTHLSIEVGDAAHNNFQKLVYRSKSQLETAPQVSDVVLWFELGNIFRGILPPEKISGWFAESFTNWAELADGGSRGESILAPMASRPLSDFDDVPRPPVFFEPALGSKPGKPVKPEKSPKGYAELEESEFMLAPRRYDPDNLAAGKKLNAAKLHKALLAMDESLGGGGTITDPAEWVTQETTDLALSDFAGVTIFAEDGAVRAVGIELGSPTKQQWRTLYPQLRRLARTLWVHFAHDQSETWAANRE